MVWLGKVNEGPISQNRVLDLTLAILGRIGPGIAAWPGAGWQLIISQVLVDHLRLHRAQVDASHGSAKPPAEVITLRPGDETAGLKLPEQPGPVVLARGLGPPRCHRGAPVNRLIETNYTQSFVCQWLRQTMQCFFVPTSA